MTNNPFHVGDRVVLIKHPTAGNPPEVLGKPGDVATVTEVKASLIEVDTDAATSNHEWWTLAEDQTRPSTRPLIDFSGDSRATARRYAVSANSRILLPASQEVLRAVANGEQVDAYALNAAVTDAMRSATTRCGQSVARRMMATQVAYLGHITQAVLENHADNLPVYEPGERSRKIDALEQELRHSTSVNQALAADLTNERARVAYHQEKLRQANAERSTLTQAASDERRRLCAEIDALKAKAAKAEKSEADLALVLVYAFEKMDGEQKQRVLGFWDGIDAL